jgi:hypothetical protein
MRKFLYLFLFNASTVFAQDAASPQQGLTVQEFVYDAPEKNFKMQVPTTWKINRDYSGYALFMEPIEKSVPSQENPVVADPNITVSITRNPMPIDKKQLNEYAKEIELKFSETNGTSNDFQIFSKNFVEKLPNGKSALLYYLTYKRNSFDVMSAVLVTSGAKHLVRITLNDYKVSFDKNLESLFPVMASIDVEGNAPSRVEAWQQYLPYGASILACIVGMSLFIIIRNSRMSNLISSHKSSSHRTSKKNTKKQSKSLPPESQFHSQAAHSTYGESDSPSSGFAESSSYANSSVAHSSAAHSVANSSYAESVYAENSVAQGSFAGSSQPAHSRAVSTLDSRYSKGSAAPPSEFGFGNADASAAVSQPLSAAFSVADKNSKIRAFETNESDFEDFDEGSRKSKKKK